MKWGMWAMQSKMSWINKELLVYIFRSSGWVSLLYLLGLLFSLPLEVLMLVLDERGQFYDAKNNLLYIHTDIQFALLLVIPVLLAVFLFRFLQVKALSDFIHSLPLSRKQIYAHHVAAGILYLLLPILLTAFTLLILHLSMDVSEIYTLADIGVWLGTIIVLVLLIFSASVFIGMITGLSALQAILTYILLLLPVGLLVLLTENMKFLLFGFSLVSLESDFSSLSPLTALTNINSVTLFSAANIIYLIIAVCLLFSSYFLYKLRKHEYVSHAFVFPVIKPVFKYGLTMGLMLFGGYYFSETAEGVEWVILGYVLGAVFGYLLAEMVLQKTWRTKLHLKGFGAYILIVLVVIFVIKLDVIGYESRVPELSNIKEVSISNNVNSYHDEIYYDVNLDRTTLKDQRNIQVIQRLHEQIIQHGEDDRLDESPKYPTIVFSYELANGHTLSREYQLSNYKSFKPYFKKIYESQEYKDKFYTLLKISPKDVYRVDITGNGYMPKSLEIRDPKEINKAIEALQTDLANASYEAMVNTKKEYGYISIPLENNRSISMGWKESFQHFNNWIESTGKADQVKLKVEEVSYMIIQEFNPHTDYYEPHFTPEKNALTIKNPDQKKEMFEETSYDGEWKYVVLLYDEGDNQLDLRGLAEEDVPDFVQGHF